MKRRTLLKSAAGAAAVVAVPSLVRAAAPLKELRLDYAYYSPSSLVLRRFGWLEEAFKPAGTDIKWVLSAGSNRALEYLNGNSIDIGSSAGLAALRGTVPQRPHRAARQCRQRPARRIHATPAPRTRGDPAQAALKATILDELSATHAL